MTSWPYDHDVIPFYGHVQKPPFVPILVAGMASEGSPASTVEAKSKGESPLHGMTTFSVFFDTLSLTSVAAGRRMGLNSSLSTNCNSESGAWGVCTAVASAR